MNGKVDYDRKLTTYINELVSKQNISDENKASTFIIEKNNNVKVKKENKIILFLILLCYNYFSRVGD